MVTNLTGQDKKKKDDEPAGVQASVKVKPVAPLLPSRRGTLHPSGGWRASEGVHAPEGHVFVFPRKFSAFVC